MRGEQDRPTIGVDLRALVPESTGIGVATISMLEALVYRGNFSYVGLSHAEIAPEKLEHAGIVCEVEPTPLGVLWQQLRLPRRLARGGIDLLWSPLLTLPWRLPGHRGTTPGVVTIHDLTPLLFPEMHRAKTRWSLRPFLRRTTEIAAAIAVDSEATSRDLAERFPDSAAKTEVVPMGVSDRFRPGSADEIEALRAELALQEGYLLHVGTLEPRKNTERLIDAWLALRQEDATTPPLVLAGGRGWHTDALSTKIERLADVGLRHLGHVSTDRLPALYRAATAFAFPSLYEGFGLPPLEAMASGVPVAVSDRSSLPEVVGDAGILFDPEDAGAIREALRSLLSETSKREERVAEGLRRAGTFTWDRAAEKMESIFRRVLSLQSAPKGSVALD